MPCLGDTDLEVVGSVTVGVSGDMEDLGQTGFLVYRKRRECTPR